MNKNVLWIIIAVLCVALFVCAYLLYDRLKDDYAPSNLAPVATEPTTEVLEETQESSESESVETAPDFTAFGAEGKSVKLSDYFGKPIVLNLWASWCPPCKAEMPHFEAAYQANDDIQFLMVNMTSGDNMDDAKALIADEGYTFPVLYDKTGEAGMVYQASSLPMTIFIGADGAVVTYAVGALSAESLNEGISLIRD